MRRGKNTQNLIAEAEEVLAMALSRLRITLAGKGEIQGKADMELMETMLRLMQGVIKLEELKSKSLAAADGEECAIRFTQEDMELLRLFTNKGVAT